MYGGTVKRVSRQDIKLVTISIEMENDNPKSDRYTDFFYAGGVSEYISRLNTNKKPLHDVLSFRKEINGITMDIGLQWYVDGYSDTMLGYVNRVRTIDGGTHIDGVKASLTRTLNSFAKKLNFFKDENITLSGEHVREGLTCIVSLIVPNPEFEGQKQMRLGNPYVRELVDQSVQEYLMQYFELHPDVLESIIFKSLNAYKTAMTVKRAREVIRSKSVSMPCTIPDKLTNRSPEKPEIFIGERDFSSGAAANHGPDGSFQRKRTREQLRRDGAVSTTSGVSLENTSDLRLEKKRQKPDPCLSSRQTANTSNPPNPKDVRDKTLEDVASGSNKTKPFIPIGPGFQAEIPVWVAPTKKGKFYGSPGDFNTLKWLGTGVWPTYSLKKKVHYKNVGEGRSDSCSCPTPRSTKCIKKHIKEAHELLESELNRAFYTWKFDEMGEEVRSKSWTSKEEQRFEALVKNNPLSSSEEFWEFASNSFPGKSKKELLSYYHNVFLINHMRLLASQGKYSADSDDDHYDNFIAG